ncbi:hypothetical protein [Archaeoglobus sp.]
MLLSCERVKGKNGEKDERDEGLEEWSVGFKRGDELFEHARIRYFKCGLRESIFVKCPRCGRIGTLRVAKRRTTGRVYAVAHGREGCKRVCKFGPCSCEYDYLDEVYRAYNSERKGSKGDESQFSFDEFGEWLRERGYSDETVKLMIYTVRSILRRYGFFKSAEELGEFLETHAPMKRSTIANYVRDYRRFLKFLEDLEENSSVRASELGGEN